MTLKSNQVLTSEVKRKLENFKLYKEMIGKGDANILKEEAYPEKLEGILYSRYQVEERNFNSKKVAFLLSVDKSINGGGNCPELYDALFGISTNSKGNITMKDFRFIRKDLDNGAHMCKKTLLKKIEKYPSKKISLLKGGTITDFLF